MNCSDVCLSLEEEQPEDLSNLPEEEAIEEVNQEEDMDDIPPAEELPEPMDIDDANGNICLLYIRNMH